MCDKTIGGGDSCSLRLERSEPGVSQSTCTTDTTFFMDGYMDGGHQLFAWVKTKDAASLSATRL